MNDGGTFTTITCDQCEAEGPPTWSDGADPKTTAIEAWNARPVVEVPSVVMDLLSDIQWNATDECSGDAQCPECLNDKKDGHADDCRLNAFLTSRTEGK